MRLTHQNLFCLLGLLLLLCLFFPACGSGSQHPPVTVTQGSSAPCSATPEGSSELPYNDKRVGGEWGDVLDETNGDDISAPISAHDFTLKGNQVSVLVHAYLATGLTLYCVQLTLYWPGLSEPNQRYSYAVAGVTSTDLNPVFFFDLDHFTDFNLFANGQILKVPCNLEITDSFDVGVKLSSGGIVYKRAPNGEHTFKRQC